VLSRHAYVDAVVIGRLLLVKALIARPMRQVQVLGADRHRLEAGTVTGRPARLSSSR
jgi:hypothetical protein